MRRTASRHGCDTRHRVRDRVAYHCACSPVVDTRAQAHARLRDSGQTRQIAGGTWKCGTTQPVRDRPHGNDRPGADLRPRIFRPDGQMPRQRHGHVSSAPPMMSSAFIDVIDRLLRFADGGRRTAARSRWPPTPSTIGAAPARPDSRGPSIVNSTACLLPSASMSRSRGLLSCCRG